VPGTCWSSSIRSRNGPTRLPRAQSDLARVNFGRMQKLVKDGVISRMDFDQASAQQKATEANVAEIRATIGRKTIRAPFSGVLGIRKVNLGQYISAGSAVVPLRSLNPVYVDFGVPQQTARQVRVGGMLHVASESLAALPQSLRNCLEIP
jgi:membrane fusion protein (multidrug efflux system)